MTVQILVGHGFRLVDDFLSGEDEVGCHVEAEKDQNESMKGQLHGGTPRTHV